MDEYRVSAEEARQSTTVREGINIFLEGFIPTENLRFRDHSLSFKVRGGEKCIFCLWV